MQQSFDQSNSSPEAEPIDQSNRSDQISYSMKNGPEDVSYKLAFEAFHVFDASVAIDFFVVFDFSVAFVQQHQLIKSFESFVSKTSKSSNSKTINHASYEKKN